MIELKINGRKYQFDGDQEMPLLWFLRDSLEMTGTKFGCGVGQCGACTVLLNGAATRACVTQMKNAAGNEVVTVEGLSGAMGDKLQNAWKQVNVPQCGYCQSGQLMSAASLLKKKPKPTDADIDAAMQGNICRCGTYSRIRKAIQIAAGIQATGARA